jgi:hypothetical protein
VKGVPADLHVAAGFFNRLSLQAAENRLQSPVDDRSLGPLHRGLNLSNTAIIFGWFNDFHAPT